MIIGTELLLSLHPKTKPLISATQREMKAGPLNGFVLHNYSTIKELLLGSGWPVVSHNGEEFALGVLMTAEESPLLLL